MFGFDIYCSQKCYHAAVTGSRLQGGNLSFADPVELSCRAQGELKVTRGPSGDLQVSDTQLFFDPETSISVDDQITYDGWTFRVGHVIKGQGLDWKDHLKVMLERGRRA